MPFLVDGEVQVGQSVAIMEYLDETCPAHPLMPSAPRSGPGCQIVQHDRLRHPPPSTTCGCSTIWRRSSRVGKEQETSWYRHWIGETFTALEQLLDDHGGVCSVGQRGDPGGIACWCPRSIMPAAST